MLVPRDKLILWTCAALYQRSEQATSQPMPRDFAVRALLAVLHTLGANKSAVDGYWQAMKETLPPIHAPDVRATNMRTQLERIMRSLHVGDALFRHEMMEALHGPSKPGSEGYRRMLEHQRQERQEKAASRRADRDCGWL